LGPYVPHAYRGKTAGEAEEHLGEKESGKILPPGLIWGAHEFHFTAKKQQGQKIYNA
jgi:hypothetical protein